MLDRATVDCWTRNSCRPPAVRSGQPAQASARCPDGQLHAGCPVGQNVSTRCPVGQKVSAGCPVGQNCPVGPPAVRMDNCTPAVRLDKMCPPAVRLDKRCPPAVRLDKKRPPAVRMDNCTPAVRLDKMCPPAVRLDKRCPPAVRLDKMCPPAVRLDRRCRRLSGWTKCVHPLSGWTKGVHRLSGWTKVSARPVGQKVAQLSGWTKCVHPLSGWTKCPVSTRCPVGQNVSTRCPVGQKVSVGCPVGQLSTNCPVGQNVSTRCPVGQKVSIGCPVGQLSTNCPVGQKVSTSCPDGHHRRVQRPNGQTRVGWCPEGQLSASCPVGQKVSTTGTGGQKVSTSCPDGQPLVARRSNGSLLPTWAHLPARVGVPIGTGGSGSSSSSSSESGSYTSNGPRNQGWTVRMMQGEERRQDSSSDQSAGDRRANSPQRDENPPGHDRRVMATAGHHASLVRAANPVDRPAGNGSQTLPAGWREILPPNETWSHSLDHGSDSSASRTAPRPGAGHSQARAHHSARPDDTGTQTDYRHSFGSLPALLPRTDSTWPTVIRHWGGPIGQQPQRVGMDDVSIRTAGRPWFESDEAWTRVPPPSPYRDGYQRAGQHRPHPGQNPSDLIYSVDKLGFYQSVINDEQTRAEMLLAAPPAGNNARTLRPSPQQLDPWGIEDDLNSEAALSSYILLEEYLASSGARNCREGVHQAGGSHQNSFSQPRGVFESDYREELDREPRLLTTRPPVPHPYEEWPWIQESRLESAVGAGRIVDRRRKSPPAQIHVEETRPGKFGGHGNPERVM